MQQSTAHMEDVSLLCAPGSSCALEEDQRCQSMTGNKLHESVRGTRFGHYGRDLVALVSAGQPLGQARCSCVLHLDPDQCPYFWNDGKVGQGIPVGGEDENRVWPEQVLVFLLSGGGHGPCLACAGPCL